MRTVFLFFVFSIFTTACSHGQYVAGKLSIPLPLDSTDKVSHWCAYDNGTDSRVAVWCVNTGKQYIMQAGGNEAKLLYCNSIDSVLLPVLKDETGTAVAWLSACEVIILNQREYYIYNVSTGRCVKHHEFDPHSCISFSNYIPHISVDYGRRSVLFSPIMSDREYNKKSEVPVLALYYVDKDSFSVLPLCYPDIYQNKISYMILPSEPLYVCTQGGYVTAYQNTSLMQMCNAKGKVYSRNVVNEHYVPYGRELDTLYFATPIHKYNYVQHFMLTQYMHMQLLYDKNNKCYYRIFLGQQQACDSTGLKNTLRSKPIGLSIIDKNMKCRGDVLTGVPCCTQAAVINGSICSVVRNADKGGYSLTMLTLVQEPKTGRKIGR